MLKKNKALVKQMLIFFENLEFFNLVAAEYEKKSSFQSLCFTIYCMALNFLWIVFGAALGASLRYLFVLFVPLPILLVNLIGSFLIGISFAKLDPSLQANLILFFNIGFLGSLTTFSTFSLETMQMLLAGGFLKASFYIILSVFVSLLFCYIGYRIGISL